MGPDRQTIEKNKPLLSVVQSKTHIRALTVLKMKQQCLSLTGKFCKKMYIIVLEIRISTK